MSRARKLTPEEVHTAGQQSKSRRELTAELYDSILAEFRPSDYGEVALGTSENRTIVRNRLHLAAARRGLTLRFLHVRGKRLRFHVEPRPETSAERSTTSAADRSHQPSDSTLAAPDATGADHIERDDISRGLCAAPRRHSRQAAAI